PTKVVRVDEQYYAVINSLSNSTYTVVWNELEFKDMANHWAKEEVNDMGSRLVIEGTGDGMFSPDRSITRADFTAIMVRGLGLQLQPEPSGNVFTDIHPSAWYSSAVNTAAAYQLISGFEDGTFRPEDPITR